MTRLLCAVFAALTLLYAGKGFWYLAVKPEPPGDFLQRWTEQRYVLAGRNPYDVFFASGKAAVHPQSWAERDSRPLREIGVPKMVGYPPWAYFQGTLFFGPADVTIARWVFAGWNLAALGVVFLAGFRVGRAFGGWSGAAIGFAGTAMSAISTTLSIGQYGLLILALLILSLWALERGRTAAAGFWHVLAATKPILSGPFGLIFLFPIRWRALAIMTAWMALANLTVWRLTGTNPAEMLLQMLASSQTFIADSYGPLNALTWLGLPLLTAELICALGCVAATCLVLALFPQAPLLTRFAVAGVAARLWSYHHLYDNLILLFLLLALAELALRLPSSLHRTAFLTVGFTLWLPGKCCDWLPFQIFQIAAWLGGLALLLRRTAALSIANSPMTDLEECPCKS